MDKREFATTIDNAGGRAYIVGGAVRDEIIGRPVHDTDYCVTGLMPETFQQLFPNATLKGKSFPVYRMNITGETSEVAMARTERKKGRGYKGFQIYTSPDISIEEDLKRRDLTINAIAKDILKNSYVDPFNGIEDIQRHTLRAVSAAFSEDPLRVFRTARFAAVYGFTVEPSTLKLMESLKNEVNSLPKERIFEELRKALGGEDPVLFFTTLKDVGILRVKNINLFRDTMTTLKRVSNKTSYVDTRFASLFANNLDAEYLHKVKSKITLPVSWVKSARDVINNLPNVLFFEDASANIKVTTAEHVYKSNLGIVEIAKIASAVSNAFGADYFINNVNQIMASVDSSDIKDVSGPNFGKELHKRRVEKIL